MSNARKNTKAVVGWLAGAGAGAATANLLRNNRNHSDHKAVDVYHDSSALVAGVVVGAAAREAARVHSDKYVDNLFDSFAKLIGNTNVKTEN